MKRRLSTQELHDYRDRFLEALDDYVYFRMMAALDPEAQKDFEAMRHVLGQAIVDLMGANDA